MLHCQTEVETDTIATTPKGGDWAWSASRRDGMIRHPDLAALYRLWLVKTAAATKRRPKPWLPQIEDFSMEDLEPWLGRINVARAIDDDFEMELIGCNITDEQGRDRTRMTLSEATFGPVGQEARTMLETVASMGIVALPAGSSNWRGRAIGWHGIVLPLANQMALTCLFVSD